MKKTKKASKGATLVKSRPAKKAAARPAPAPRAKASGGIMNQRELDSVRKKLMATKEELIRIVNTKRKLDLTEPDVGDGADQASQSLEKEMLFELSDNERVMLDQIESALRRIEKKSYGICEACRRPIGKQRLKAIPAARYCISCQSSNESAAF